MHYLARDLNTDETAHHFRDLEAYADIEPIFTGPAAAILSPDWTQAAWREDTTLFLQDITAETTVEIPVDADVITRLWFSPDSTLLVGATFTGEFSSLRLWDAATGTELAAIGLSDFDVLDVFFTADMSRLVARITAAMALEPEPEQLVVWAVP